MAAGGRSPSLWERVCAEYEAEQPQFPDVPGSKHGAVSLEAGISQPFHMEQFYSVPAADSAVQELLPTAEAAAFPDPPDPKTCSPAEYLEYYIFPVLLPGMVELLHQAEKEKCFERKRTKFIACDFLTEWLYNKNPKRKDESFTEFFSIPFVKDWLKDWGSLLVPAAFTVDFIVSSQMASSSNLARVYRVQGLIKSPQTQMKDSWGLWNSPRPPIPLSLLLSEEEASIIIQSFWRGYRVRCDSEIQELRQWQKQLREEKNIMKRVEEFWMKQEAKVGSKWDDSEEPTQSHSAAWF